MGRPSNRDERYGQVMEAFVRCVARMGLDGATLSTIAREAGLTRPLIRHHLGNRDEMIQALQDYVLDQFDSAADELIAALPDAKPAHALINYLFSDQSDTSPDLVLAFAALTARACENDELRTNCRDSILRFEAQVTEVLQRNYLDASEINAQRAAHGIVALYYNTASLAALEMPTEWVNQSKAMAISLCKNLEELG